MDRDSLAEIIWKSDGPLYQGWPDNGQRVDWAYSTNPNWKAQRARCFKVADAILDKLKKPQALNTELLEACQAMLAQLEDAMTGEINEMGQRWITGKTDLELRPDGSYWLSQVRMVVAKASAH